MLMIKNNRKKAPLHTVICVLLLSISVFLPAVCSANLQWDLERKIRSITDLDVSLNGDHIREINEGFMAQIKRLSPKTCTDFGLSMVTDETVKQSFLAPNLEGILKLLRRYTKREIEGIELPLPDLLNDYGEGSFYLGHIKQAENSFPAIASPRDGKNDYSVVTGWLQQLATGPVTIVFKYPGYPHLSALRFESSGNKLSVYLIDSMSTGREMWYSPLLQNTVSKTHLHRNSMLEITQAFLARWEAEHKTLPWNDVAFYLLPLPLQRDGLCCAAVLYHWLRWLSDIDDCSECFATHQAIQVGVYKPLEGACFSGCDGKLNAMMASARNRIESDFIALCLNVAGQDHYSVRPLQLRPDVTLNEYLITAIPPALATIIQLSLTLEVLEVLEIKAEHHGDIQGDFPALACSPVTHTLTKNGQVRMTENTRYKTFRIGYYLEHSEPGMLSSFKNWNDTDYRLSSMTALRLFMEMVHALLFVIPPES
ncbi:hypothetical protein [Spongorhabdus nitratireducens]